MIILLNVICYFSLRATDQIGIHEKVWNKDRKKRFAFEVLLFFIYLCLSSIDES